MEIKIRTIKKSDGYIAMVEDKKIGCMGDGATELEAIEDVTKVMLDILEMLDEDGVIKLGK